MPYQAPIRGKYLKKPSQLQPTGRDLADSVSGVAGITYELKQLKNEVVDTVNAKLEEVDSKLTSLTDANSALEDTQNEAIELIKSIKQGEPGKNAEPVDEVALEARLTAKIPKLDTEKLSKSILSKVPKLDEAKLTKTLTKSILKAIPENKASLKIIQQSIEVDPMSVIEKIMALPATKLAKLQLNTDNISGLKQTMSAFQSQLGRGYLHGGGDTVGQGTNITINTVNGVKIISSTGGGAVTSLTTIGSSGASTLIAGVLNIPVYTGGGGGSPGGLNAQIQYNNLGSFGGISGATTDGTAVSLSGAHLLNPTINGAGTGLATLVYPNTSTSVTITVPATTGTLALTSQLTSGTVTSVASADGSVTVTNPTTTVDLAVVKAPIWSTARLLAGNSVNGSTNVPFANKFIIQGTTDTALTGAQFLGALTTGLVKNTTTTGVLSIAVAGTDYQAPGNYITALTGDATASGPGSVALTLATVNSNVGSFTNANITVNAKGLITAASNGTSASGSANTNSITQAAHGFTVGQVVERISGSWVLAKADSANDAEAIGMVTTVTSSSVFVITTDGYVPTSAGITGLTDGTTYYLSPTTAGALTATPPTTLGQISKPLFNTDSTTSGYFSNFRGQIISPPAPTSGNYLIASVGITVDGGGSVPTTGSKGFVVVPYACTINSVTLLANASGSIVFDIKKSTYAGFPTNTSIVASAPPTLSSVQKNQDTTLTGWTTTVSAGDVLEFLVSSVATVTRVNLILSVTKS